MPNDWRMHSRLLSKLACETITPFGSLVEPDVYCRNARSLSATLGGCHMSASASSSSSVAIHWLVAASADSSSGSSVVSVCAGRKRDVRVAIERDPLQPRHRPLRLRIRRRHRDDARVQATEERGDEFQPGRIHQQRAVARPQLQLQPRGNRPRPAIQLAERDLRHAVAIVEKCERRRVRDDPPPASASSSIIVRTGDSLDMEVQTPGKRDMRIKRRRNGHVTRRMPTSTSTTVICDLEIGRIGQRRIRPRATNPRRTSTANQRPGIAWLRYIF